ncbi:MAG TPA: nuclear transport factor 2 family protein [Candidatus Dormibacteraeota bacterium]
MQMMDATAELGIFEGARDAYRAALKEVPPAALAYLRAGDDYSLGGLTVHVNYVLEHYLGVLRAMREADFAECRPEDPPGLEETAKRRARTPLSEAEVDAELEATSRLHGEVAELVAGLESMSRQAPVWFPGASEVYPTSASDVLGWLTGHYREHVPHIGALTEAWRQETETAATRDVVTRFSAAFVRGDVDAVMALMTDDCVFENTYPPPDGELHAGQADVRKFWESFFASTPEPHFETEDFFVSGDRALARWRFSWGGDQPGHVRGVDVFRVRDGKVAEKLSYVKG